MSELEKARAFKTYVHEYLDAAGVPIDPAPEKTAETGCRIEGRLAYVFDRLERCEQALREIATLDVETYGLLPKVKALGALRGVR